MCDNEIDRDYEYFPADTLTQMANLFGWARLLFPTTNARQAIRWREFTTPNLLTGEYSLSGENYTQLVAKCLYAQKRLHSRSSPQSKPGITKKVSISCAIKSAVCSICGTDNRETYCKHWNGETYDGEVCYFALKGALDAYELSFVAVPAQPKGGGNKVIRRQRSRGKTGRSKTEHGKRSVDDLN